MIYEKILSSNTRSGKHLDNKNSSDKANLRAYPSREENAELLSESEITTHELDLDINSYKSSWKEVLEESRKLNEDQREVLLTFYTSTPQEAYLLEADGNDEDFDVGDEDGGDELPNFDVSDDSDEENNFDEDDAFNASEDDFGSLDDNGGDFGDFDADGDDTKDESKKKKDQVISKKEFIKEKYNISSQVRQTFPRKLLELKTIIASNIETIEKKIVNSLTYDEILDRLIDEYKKLSTYVDEYISTMSEKPYDDIFSAYVMIHANLTKMKQLYIGLVEEKDGK